MLVVASTDGKLMTQQFKSQSTSRETHGLFSVLISSD